MLLLSKKTNPASPCPSPILLLFHRRKSALLWDVVQVLRNALAFNEEGSLIVQHAKILVHTLVKFIT